MFSFKSLTSMFSGTASGAKAPLQARLQLENLETRLVPAATNQSFVQSAILALDNRPFNASTDQQFVTALNNGATPTAVALQIEKSADGIAHTVDNLFTHLLLRHADSMAQTTFGGMLSGGATLQDVKAMIMGSDEYFQFAGGTNDKFISSVFADQLGRAVDPTGQAFFGGELNATPGVTTRTLVAKQVIQSPEGGLKETLVLFNTYLQRTADISGLSFFGSQLINSPLFGGVVTDEQSVIASLVGSTEFYNASSTT